MAEDNWAAFGSSSEQKDDWGDFGGFESATPASDAQGSGTASPFISWAAIPSVNPANQYTSPLDAADISSTVSQGAPSVGSTTAVPANQQVPFTAAFPSMSNQRAPSSIPMQEKNLNEARELAKIAMENKVEDLEMRLSTAEKEKMRMQQELNGLLEKSKKAENEAEKLAESLEKQNDKYKKLQDEHQEQIEEIRKGGHDALAIIVEEYKELSKKAVIEQQEQSGIEMQTFLVEERRKFQQIIKEQQEGFEAVLREEREKNSKQTEEALEEQRGKHKEEIQSCLQEERQKSQEAVNKAVEEAREQGVESMKRTVQQEKEGFEKTIEEQKESVLKMIEEERQKSREIVEEAIKKERENSKVTLLEALAQERQHSKEVMKEAVEETKKEMLEYLKEKQKADAACRHRHFLGLDLFLESARTQLQTLMNDKEDDTL